MAYSRMNLKKEIIINSTQVLSLIVAVALLGSCKSATSNVESNAETGTFKGNVALVNARGDTLPDYSGATVSIEGTLFQATSSATGDWEIDNVPAGVYNLILTKPGFDTLVIPQFQTKGVGTSFVLGAAIQALPLDSLVFTVSNIVEDSSSAGYLGLLSMSGYVSGPDSLSLTEGVIVASGEIGQSPTVVITNGQITNLNTGAIGYNVPPHIRGGVVGFQSYLYASDAKAKYTYFQRASSPYVLARTFRLP